MTATSSAPPHESPTVSRRWTGLALCLALVVSIQLWAGAYLGERGTYSDEAAHFMNGLLVRDYVYDGLGQNPLAFARDYYLTYPKIAPGMWPPLFHALLGVFLLPGWRPDIAALVLVAAISAWAVWRLCDITGRIASPAAVPWVALTFALTPLTISLSSTVMVDILVASLTLEATYWLARFAESRSVKHAAAFGLATALGCMTKGNAISVIFTPALLILLTNRYNLLLKSGLYLSALIVVLLAVPPLWVSLRLDSSIGDFSPLTLATVLERMWFYSQTLYRQMGLALTSLAAVGMVSAIARGREAGVPWSQALLSLVGGAMVFHLLSPHTLSDERYITLAIAPMVGLAAFGIDALASRAGAMRAQQVVRVAILVGALASTALGASTAIAPKPLGYRALVDRIAAASGLDRTRTLVVSNEQGEGALVSEVARRRPERGTTVIRGSKLLAADDWMGRNLELRFATGDAIMRSLEDLHVDYLVFDLSYEARHELAYWDQVQQLVNYSDRLERLFVNTPNTTTGPTRQLVLYRLKFRSSGPAKPVEVDLSRYRLR